MLTSGADVCGWIDDRGRVDHHPAHLGAQQLGLGDAACRRPSPGTMNRLMLRIVRLRSTSSDELIARHDDAVETRVVDLDEIEQTPACFAPCGAESLISTPQACAIASMISTPGMTG